MSAVEQLEALTNEPGEGLVLLDGVEYKVPVLKARHISKVVKLLMPFDKQIMAGNFDVVYKDLDVLMSIVSVFYDKDENWAGDLVSKDLYQAFSVVIEANPDFFIEVVANVMARQ